jgi:hypothetical protein
MNNLLMSFLDQAETESRRDSIEKVINYLNNNWPGIQARRIYRDILVGCSAEGHVSHVLSARLSSRPMGWSYIGANQVAHLRVHHANGVNLHDAYLKNRNRNKDESFYDDLAKPPKETLPKASGDSHEIFGNIPTLRRGAGLSLGYLLRRISNTNQDF